MEQHSFGYWLRLKRKALDLTREVLAERIGYSAATIRKIEDEERRPSVQIAGRLADIFNIPQNERESFISFARGELRSVPAENKEDSPWLSSTRPSRSNLPAPASSLIGREQEIALIREYLSKDDTRLVTLIGPPGIGKTRLSIEAARAALPDFPDGVFFVALALLQDATLIAQAVAQSLGYVGAKNISTTEQLKEGIGDKHVLLVLDNCEHLIEEISSLASDLLSACSRLKVLATSRESLRISGEWLYSVPAFDVPNESSAVDMENASNFPALTLFAERARAVRPDFALTAENIQTVTSICSHLDGLPLVIELIAARLRLMSPESLLARLNQQFILSADGMRAASARQKTLKDAIGWSYNLLSAEEQKLFARLAVFSGGFTLDEAEAIFSQTVTEKPVSDLIALLLDKSLLQRAQNEHDGTRYTMLVTIQEFARERLRQMGEETEIRNLHLAYFLDLAEKGGKEMRGLNQLEWLNRLNLDRDNLRSALDWAIETGQTETALRMARKLHWFWFVRGDHSEARHSLGRVLALSDASQYGGPYAEALTQLAHHNWTQIGPKEARPFVEQALSISHAHAEKWNTARALAILGLVLIEERDFAVAQSTLEESRNLFREVHDEWEYAHTVMCLALGAYRQDVQALSLDLHEQALTLFREIGDRYFQSFALNFIGILHVRQGDVEHGMAALREALILLQQLDSKYGIANVILYVSRAEQYAGNPARAVRLAYAAKIGLDSVGAWTGRDEAKLGNDLASCRAALGEEAFAEAVEQGRAMTMEQAIQYALEADTI